MSGRFIPVTKREMDERGWDELDIIIISGDAYVDHPSFGTALIARFLESHGFRAGIIPQPDWNNPSDFLQLGKPRLFYAVSAGNMDSLVCNRTSSKKTRHSDMYSPGGKSGLRPDRALIVYCNVLRQVSKDIPIVIGGIEASLRRLAHYDYWSNSVRRSILLDSRANILVYGMGEKPILAIAQCMHHGIGDISSIPGTVLLSHQCPSGAELLPSYEDVSADKLTFARAHMQFVRYFLKRPDYPIVQKHQNRFLIHNPPGQPLTTLEMDTIYDLPFLRRAHPRYDAEGGVPALEPVKFSVTSHRGCFGGCSFCALFFHQGHIIQQRSAESILNEVQLLAADPDFKGYITDIGGPTANMYGIRCSFHAQGTHCGKGDCLGQSPCPNLNRSHTEYLNVLEQARRIPGVKKIFISSGIRYDLFPPEDEHTIITQFCAHHISGQMKIAPEHVSEQVLSLMKKPDKEKYIHFMKIFESINRHLRKKQYLIPYFVTAHPGCTNEHMKELALFLKKMGFIPDQIQDFLPTPMTSSSCMFYTGIDPETETTIFVPRSDQERFIQRKILHEIKQKNTGADSERKKKYPSQKKNAKKRGRKQKNTPDRNLNP